MATSPKHNHQARPSPSVAQRALWASLGAAVTLVAARAADIARPAKTPLSTATTSSTTSTKDTSSNLGTTVAMPSAAAQLAANRKAAEVFKALQVSARAIATDLSKAPADVKANMKAIQDGLAMQKGGLVIDPQVLADWNANLNSSLWTGADHPVQTTNSTSGGTLVSIRQTQAQAVLSWETFNIDRTTTLQFDQSAGGSNASQWIAFNKVGVTGAPSQILGHLQTVGAGKDGALGAPGSGGQVYVINPNGIIFGGSAQVDTHALVASSLQINDNLIVRGLINNPDSQFLFSSLSIPAGSQTSAFTPKVSDLATVESREAPTVASSLPTFTTAKKVAAATDISVNLIQRSDAPTSSALVSGEDYTVDTGADGRASIQLTTTGFAKASGSSLKITYTPRGDENGNVVVNAGALLQAPTNSEHVGGRIALVGANVTNNGTLSTPDGQVILAAGLQVGFAAHTAADASLRGLDAYVGAVSDPSASATDPVVAGTVKNDGSAVGSNYASGGVINADRGNVTLTGKTVEQNGAINSSTSVSLNGRIDLLADYDAVVNPQYAAKPESESPFWFSKTGDVSFGEGSVAQIVPKDPDSTTTESTVGYQLALPSLVNIRGRSVHFGKDSLLQATGARVATGSPFVDNQGNALTNGVTVNAGAWFLTGLDSATPQRYFLFDDNDHGQIFFDSGAEIDVSGSKDVVASVKENFVDVELRGVELANSPLQRDGVLRGKTITVDSRVHGPWDPTLNGGLGGYTWIGTPVADTSGYLGLVKRTVGELTTGGGTVALRAGGSVVMQANSHIDVSGGSIQYTGAEVGTTKLLSNGHVYDISQATPDLTYDGIVSKSVDLVNATWGVTDSFGNTRFLSYYENGYVQGASAGGVSFTAPALALDGKLSGSTVVGPHQRDIVPHDTEAMRANASLQYQSGLVPESASLALSLEAFRYNAALLNPLEFYSPENPTIRIKSGSSAAAAADFALDPVTGTPLALRADRKSEIVLAPSLFATVSSGQVAINFGRVSIKNINGSVFVDSNATLFLGHAGSLAFNAANIDIEGAVIAPGGDLSFTAANYSIYEKAQRDLDSGIVPSVAAGRGKFTLGESAFLDTSGWVIDDRVRSANSGQLPYSITGGNVSINAFDTELKTTRLTTAALQQRGGGIDVSGGALMNARGKVSYGSAGKISLSGGVDPNYDAVGQTPETTSDQKGSLKLGATLSGMSGTSGGTLELSTRSLYVGPASGAGDSLALDPSLFNTGGFSHFKLTGIGESVAGNPGEYVAGVTIGDNVLISPTVRSWRVQEDASGGLRLASLVLNPALNGPMSLDLSSPGVNNIDSGAAPYARGDIVIGKNSSIILNANAKSSMSISGRTVSILGSIFVPGGTLKVEGAKDSSTLGFASDVTRAVPTVFLGNQSVLSTAGATVAWRNALGYYSGVVLNGGNISVTGNIVAAGRSVDAAGKELARGAILDVSGTNGALDYVSTQLNPESPTVGLRYQTTIYESDGGTLSLNGSQMLWSDANLLGDAGGKSAVGGSLEISSGRYSPLTALKPSEVTLVVNKSGSLLPSSFLASSESPLGRVVVPATTESGSVNRVVDENGAAIYDTDSSGSPVYDLGHFALSRFTDGKFEKLTLKGNVKFSGDMSLDAKQSATIATGGFLYATGKVKITAPYVALGTAFRSPFDADLEFKARSAFNLASNPYYIAPTYGPGSLEVSAKLIDVGSLSLQGVGTASLSAVHGDIRGDGTLDMAGNLSLSAGQIYPATAVDFNLAVYDYTENGVLKNGHIEVGSGDSRDLPWSVGGHLGLYASEIVQGGTLRAPFGSITLGWDGTGTAPLDPITGRAFAASNQYVKLKSGSVTSVSAVDPVTKKGLVLPYGFDANGTTWYDPAGTNITLTGITDAKTIRIAAKNIVDEAGSIVDLTGGGDLQAYRWVTGTNGTKDILNSSASFAVIPSYSATYAPYAEFNSKAKALSNDSGYSTSGINVGDRVYLGAAGGLAAGYYTVLPARYAFLPGAYLVTRKSDVPNGSIAVSDGSYLVTGYRFSGLNNARSTKPLYSMFEVISGSAALNGTGSTSKIGTTRAQYDRFAANTFFPESAAKNSLAASPTLPIDAGQLVLTASDSLVLQGSVAASSIDASGRGGLVDISSSKDITISDTAGVAASSGSGKLVLDSKDLTQFGAESLLIGGTRSRTTDGTVVNVTAGTLTVDNNGTDGGLSGSEVILVANGSVVVEADSIVSQNGASAGAAENLVIKGSAKLSNVGDSLTFQSGGRPISLPSGTGSGKLTASVPGFVTLADGTKIDFRNDTPFSVAQGATVTLSSGGSLRYATASTSGPIAFSIGDGAMLRVTSNAGSLAVRSGVTSLNGVTVSVASGARIQGASGGAVVDSTGSTLLAGGATLTGGSVGLSSGQVSMLLSDTPLVPSGLVLSQSLLETLAAGTKSLSLSSYSSIDLYGGPAGGSFGSDSLDTLSLHAAQLRGFGEKGGESAPAFFLSAKNISLDNDIGGTALAAFTHVDGTSLSSEAQAGIDTRASLALNASNVFTLGRTGVSGSEVISQFGSVTLAGAKGLLLTGSNSLSVSGDLDLHGSKIVGAASAKQSVEAAGSLLLSNAANSTSSLTSGLGASLDFKGASVRAATNVEALSGNLSLHATGADGSVLVGGLLNANGTEKAFQKDAYNYTSAGTVSLTSDHGNVVIDAGASISVDAAASLVTAGTRDGNAGTVAVKASEGLVSIASQTLSAHGGTGASAGTFHFDAAGLDRVGEVFTSSSGFAALASRLTNAGFTQEQSFRFRTGDVLLDGTSLAHRFFASADSGSLTLSGTIDASGATGGLVELEAFRNVTLTDGAKISVRGLNFDAAGKGGSIWLGAGAAVGGVSQASKASDAVRSDDGRLPDAVAKVDVRAGAILDLRVDALSLAADSVAAAAAAQKLGQVAGVLHLRAPQTNVDASGGAPDVQINPLPSGSVLGASSIEFEGFKVYAPSGGSIDSIKNLVAANGTLFAGAANADKLVPLLGGAVSTSLVHLQPGAEIVNYAGGGNLTLSRDWDLSTLRYGTSNSPESEVGVLTLRTSGNLIFNGSLSDGFISGQINPNTAVPFELWQEALLDAGSKSWSYRLTAGADATASLFSEVKTAARDTSGLATSGSLKLGKNGSGIASTSSGNATTTSVVTPYYQVIRTGSGNIDIFAGGDVLLLNQFATIYTAGSQVSDPTLGGSFDTPVVVQGSTSHVGVAQQSPYYPAQFASGGGNVTINAGGDIARLKLTSSGSYVDDSSQEMPNNWLYRRGNVDASTGLFARHVTVYNDNGDPLGGEVMSTAWWVDYSNFFEGVGALGGGNVSLFARGSVRNVDAVIPTNARMAGVDTTTGLALKPNRANLIELGGGNLRVQAGNNIDAGTYYVERGSGVLAAGNAIKTNATRDPTLAYVGGSAGTSASERWLPTTLFLGKGQFSVSAGGDLLLGPVANTFLLPQGVNNSYWYKTYFSTYDASSAVAVSSLNGAISLRESSTTPLLSDWFSTVLKFSDNSASTASSWRPWLRLVETEVGSLFDTGATLLPPTLSVTAFNGNINTVGQFTLAPSATGSLDLLAAGSINSLQSVGAASVSGNRRWVYSTFNLSDADPSAMPGVANPLAPSSPIPTDYDQIDTGLGWVDTQVSTQTPLFAALDSLFAESGSVLGAHGVLQSKQALHAAGILHLLDYNPIHIYADAGSISGLELYSAKETRFIAGLDIRDVGLYVQNSKASDTTLVSAGRDIVLFDPSSPLRLQATSKGNLLFVSGLEKSGDVQISGPGTLEVLAGRNLDLGAGRNPASQTAADLNVGITSIGDARNPYLNLGAAGGAGIVVGAGMGTAGGLDRGAIDVTPGSSFVARFLDPSAPGSLATTYLPTLAKLMGKASGSSNADVWSAFNALDTATQSRLALGVFNLVLRDAGKNFNDPKSSGFGNYNIGYEAIATLFHNSLDFSSFEQRFLNPSTAGAASDRTRAWLASALGLSSTASSAEAWSAYQALSQTARGSAAAKVFQQVLLSPSFLVSTDGKESSSNSAAIASLFKAGEPNGQLALSSREIRTKRGGDISLFAPLGGIALGTDVSAASSAPPGILTEFGGNISLFARDSIDVGTSRVFTLRGGNEILWSTVGDIGAGRSSKTVKSAPPTQVKVDPQSADVTTDIAGLATGGGIGVLAAVAGVDAGNVDLIAPAGTVDAGDAGIRSTGNLNIAALHVVNAGNISAGGASTGGQVSVAAPSLAVVASASSTAASASSAGAEAIKPGSSTNAVSEIPSLISVEVLGYGGDDDDEEGESPSADRRDRPQVLSSI